MKGDNLLQRKTIYSKVDYPWRPCTDLGGPFTYFVTETLRDWLQKISHVDLKMYFSEFCVGPFNFTQLYLHIDFGEFLFLENWRFQGAESTLSAVWISIGTRTRPNCETLWTATDWTLCEVSTFLFDGITIRQSGSFPSQTSVRLICFIFYSNAVLYFAFVFCLLFSFSLHMRDYTKMWCTLTRVLNLSY